MMGSVAKGVYANHGKIIGIAPEWMHEFEEIYPHCNKIFYTKSMSERKRLFLVKSDAFIVTPGGIGTLDEFFEIITLKKLEIHSKPIVIFNINNFYDSMIKMIEDMINENTVSRDSTQLYHITTTVDETMDYLENY